MLHALYSIGYLRDPQCLMKFPLHPLTPLCVTVIS